MRLISIDDGSWKQLTISFNVVSKQIPSSLTKFDMPIDDYTFNTLENCILIKKNNACKIISMGIGNKEFVLFVFQIRISK